jgi:ABC-type transport system involved in multi-copper enzyme maturation permease subunit
MLGTLIEKELKGILLSPKFVAVFAVCSMLIVLSIYLGVEDYRASMAHYESVNTNNRQQMRDARSWRELGSIVTRHPDPMQIFVSGINNDIGRQSSISRGIIKLYNSHYSENTLFAVFRSMDLMFIVQIVLSLFAILFTYDSINGEKETGTLRLSFANPLPRSKYIIAKIVGSWLGLVIPLLLPLLLGIMLILFYKIPMTPTHWLQLCLLIFISILYFSFFLCLGTLLSSLTEEPSRSFLYLLVIWVSFALIIPRAGVMAAGHFISVPTAAEISSKYSQKSRQLSDKYIEWINAHMKEHMSALGSMSPEERKTKSDQFTDEIKEMGEKLSQDRAQYDALLKEDWRNRKFERERLGFSLSRFSPASAFQMAAMNLAETGILLKNNYEDQLRTFSDIFTKFRAKKDTESGDEDYRARMEGKTKPLELSDVPEFEFVNTGLKKLLQSTLIDMGLLSFYILIIIAGTFVAFNRYDVR